MQLVQAAGGKDAKSQAKLCGRSSFHAAGDRATSTPGRLLSGRFILGCSHLLILRAANMPAKFGGERYAYPVLMIAGEYCAHLRAPPCLRGMSCGLHRLLPPHCGG